MFVSLFRRSIPFVFAAIILSVCLSSTAYAQDEGEEEETILVFLGDVVFDRIIGDKIQAEGIQFPFEPMKPYLSDADLTFANLETPISERGKAEPDKYCTFRSDKNTVNCLIYAGIDTVSLANNHCLDYGHDALNDTLMYLDKTNISYAGLFYDDPIENSTINRPVILEANGLKFGFLAYAEDMREWIATNSTVGPMPLDTTLMKRDVEHCKEEVDFLIVSIHWRKWPQYTTGPEPNDKVICHNLIDWGADLIMGHGPHTVHEVEGYGDGLILYSLGNAAMDCGDELSDNSYVARVYLKGDTIFSLTLIPTVKQTYRYVPEGTPLTRNGATGLNVTYQEVMAMYTNDIFNVSEGEGAEKNEWFLYREEAPWYYKVLSVFVLLVSIAAIVYILYSIFKKRDKSLLNLEEEFYGPRDQEMQPGPDPGGGEQPAKDKERSGRPRDKG
jgi:poly-gamma-glutamate synthesis protein (capsule biosynthesis protein)